MQPIHEDREVRTRGTSRTGSFGFNTNDAAWIKVLLRDKIYTDKIAAVLREYVANAWDANRENGKGDVPLIIHLPTFFEPWFSVRDYGLGLSEKAVFEVYTQYGASTKRETNDAVGMLGIGSKSAFSYTDQFSVTSWQDGFKSTYSAMLTDVDDSMVKLGSWASDELSGVEVKVPVAEKDIDQFTKKATFLYAFLDPAPQINVPLTPFKVERRENGFLEETHRSDIKRISGNQWVAVMGCIPYKIDLAQIAEALKEEGLWGTVCRMIGGLYLNIGDVEVAASREELEYKDRTRTVLVEHFKLLIMEFVSEIANLAVSEASDPWQKRLKFVHLKYQLNLPVPPEFSEWALQSIYVANTIKSVPKNKDAVGTAYIPAPGEKAPEDESEEPQDIKKFALVDAAGTVDALHVNQSTRVYLRDDDHRRKLVGYDRQFFGRYAVALSPKKGFTLEEAAEDFNRWAVKMNFTGVPMTNISTIRWEPNNGRGGNVNPKYKVNTFVLKDNTNLSYSTDYALNWEITKREPQDDDVFVVISHFKCVEDGANVYLRIMEDRSLCKTLGITMPNVYGYKTTQKNPVSKADIPQGTEYREWRDTFFLDLIRTRLAEEMEVHACSHVVDFGRDLAYDRNTHQWVPVDNLAKLMVSVATELGANHMITRFATEIALAYSKWKTYDQVKKESLKMLFKRGGEQIYTQPAQSLKAIWDRYPMLCLVLEGHLAQMGDRADSKTCFDYVKQVDIALEHGKTTAAV